MKLDIIENEGIKEIFRLSKKYGINPFNLAINLDVVPIRIYEILKGKRGITADTDLRLCKFFNLKEGHFLEMQMEYDLSLTKERISSKLANIKNIDSIRK